jgi:hypothetical protein
MTTSMKKKFDFVNIAGNAVNAITDNLIDREYEINVSAASAAQAIDTTIVANHGCLPETGGE